MRAARFFDGHLPLGTAIGIRTPATQRPGSGFEGVAGARFTDSRPGGIEAVDGVSQL